MQGFPPAADKRVTRRWISATKSFVGTIMLMLIEQKRVDPAKPVAAYVPELKDSGFGRARTARPSTT